MGYMRKLQHAVCREAVPIRTRHVRGQISNWTRVLDELIWHFLAWRLVEKVLRPGYFENAFTAYIARPTSRSDKGK